MLVDEPREQRVGAEAAQEAGRADHLLRAVQRRLHAEPALASRARERLVPLRARRVGGREQRAQPRDPLLGAEAVEAASPRLEKYWRGTFSGRRTGSRRRTETTSAPAASAFSHSVAAAMPGADDRRPSSAYSCGSYA